MLESSNSSYFIATLCSDLTCCNIKLSNTELTGQHSIYKRMTHIKPHYLNLEEHLTCNVLIKLSTHKLPWTYPFLEVMVNCLMPLSQSSRPWLELADMAICLEDQWKEMRGRLKHPCYYFLRALVKEKVIGEPYLSFSIIVPKKL